MRKTITILAGPVVLALLFVSAAAAPPSFAQVEVGVSVEVAPPDLPVYEQPPCPGDDYIWNPGYWAWDGDDYYWVPGTWVLAPEPGFFWTPGYWAWGGRGYVFSAGYWGPAVGFYGGINYGYGYFGRGYEGGRWDRGHFYYNREVNNVNVRVVHNTYNTTVVNRNVNVTRVSYNGGNGGVNVRATSQEEAVARERHIAPVAVQTQHAQEARTNQQLRANVNHGKPPIAATEKPASFRGNGVVAAREAGVVHNNDARPANGNGNGTPPRTPPSNGNVVAPNSNPSHARDIRRADRPPAPNTGNQKLDQKYQQQQEKLSTQQARDQQKLQQRQDKEDQRITQQRADDARKQQTEQRHQQQTQQMVQKHTQQTERMQQKQQPRPQPHPSSPPPPQQHPPKKP